MAEFDPLDWLISLDVERARRAAYTVLCVGALTSVVFSYWMIQIPWQVTDTSPTVVAYGGRCGGSGAVYFISVNGRHYECGGSDTKCPTHHEGPIAYDPRQPSNCRLAKNVRRLSRSQLNIVILGTLISPYGFAFLAWDSAWASRGQSNSWPLKYRLWRTIFFASIACMAAFALWCIVAGSG